MRMDIMVLYYPWVYHAGSIVFQDTETDQETDIDLSIHCVTCGIALMPKVALRHMEKCYMKVWDRLYIIVCIRHVYIATVLFQSIYNFL